MRKKDECLFKPKGSSIYWTDFRFKGKRYRESTRTADIENARLFRDELKAQLQRAYYLGTPLVLTEAAAPEIVSGPTVYVWEDGTQLYRNNMRLTEFRSKETSEIILNWLDERLCGVPLNDITKDIIQELIFAKLDEGVKRSTVKRYLDVLKATLKLAHEKHYIATMPTFKRLAKEEGRLRALTAEEWDRLVKELPHHLRQMARFAVATGLRRRNITYLQWQNINWQTRQLKISATDAKGKRTYTIQLNDDAMAVLEEQRNGHPTWVFTYKGQPVKYTKSTAWNNACVRAGIDVVERRHRKTGKWVKTTTFVFHGLRHTWASWHLMNQTTLKELQELGGWRDFGSMEIYGHLASHHLANIANNCKPVSGEPPRT